MTRSHMRIGKGSQEVNKSLVEAVLRSVQKPIVRMDLIPPSARCLCQAKGKACKYESKWVRDWFGLETTLASPHPTPMARGVPPKFFSLFS